MKDKALSVLTLFTSSGTLLCCVLPAVVATIAGGAAVSSMLSAFPFLIPLSMNKGWIFGVSAILIAINGYIVFKPNQEVACDVEVGEDGCEVTGRFNKRMFYISASVLVMGAFFAYALVPILVYFDL
jgi:mercuric ion transport protein